MKKILIICLIVLLTFTGCYEVTKIEDNSLASSENPNFSSYSEENSFSSITISNDISSSTIESDIISEEIFSSDVEESITISKETEEELKIIYVYITTKAGEKYHKASCRWIKNKDIQQITLEEAISQGYTACKTCKP